jgi:hypothetical protein
MITFFKHFEVTVKIVLETWKLIIFWLKSSLLFVNLMLIYV